MNLLATGAASVIIKSSLNTAPKHHFPFVTCTRVSGIVGPDSRSGVLGIFADGKYIEVDETIISSTFYTYAFEGVTSNVD